MSIKMDSVRRVQNWVLITIRCSGSIYYMPPSACDSSTLRGSLQEEVKSMYENIKDIGSLQVYPFRVSTTRHRLKQTNARTHFSSCPSLFWCTGLWHLLMLLVTGWECDSCPYARPSLAKVITHKHTPFAIATQGLHSRAQTKEVKALCPLSLLNFKCHVQPNRVAWLTAGLLCEDVSSF